MSAPVTKMTPLQVSSKAPKSPPSATKGWRLYAAPILFSAFLLFLVQPMLAKAILPWFGGVASVWIVAMLFFQGVLLLGYAYSYLVVRFLPARVQPLCHLALLLASLLLMPVDPWRFWLGNSPGDPSIQILRLLSVTVGVPYFLLSSTGPLLQSWYSNSHRVAFPYWLFALSNLGSLIALFAYPLAIEPFVTTHHQILTWSALYFVFAFLCGGAAVSFLGRPSPMGLTAVESHAQSGAVPKPGDYLAWLGLAACGSALLVTVMNHLCQNVAPIPLLWVLPMATYLLTFILCFDRRGWYRPTLMRWLLPPALLIMMFGVFYPTDLPGAEFVIALYLAGLFVACMFTHGELARRKPHATYLTSFYLMLAAGGAVASLFIGLLAPHVADWQVEFPETLLFCGLLALMVLYPRVRATRGAGAILLASLVLFAAGLVHPVWMKNVPNKVVLRARSFYSVLSVADTFPFEIQSLPLRVLRHAWTLHGSQVRAERYENLPGSYYAPKSAPGLLLTRRSANWNVAVIGLGAGTLAAYGRPGDAFTFYEIDPLIARVANDQFTYLKKSKASLRIVIGDGRLSMQRAAPAEFNLLVVDAFSNDSIPMHLLTREAFDLYFSRLRPEGVIAIHISNRFVDLSPLLSSMTAAMGKQAIFVHSEKNSSTGALDADWVLIANSRDGFKALPSSVQIPLAPPTVAIDPWTDDYSNLIQLLR
jgi:hypothetical protein